VRGTFLQKYCDLSRELNAAPEPFAAEPIVVVIPMTRRFGMNIKAMTGIAALALAAFVAASPAKADDVLQVVPDTIDAASDLVVGTVDAVLGDDDYDYAYYDTGPRSRCHPGREQGPDGSWHPVTVCE
jgi:hypothetical protein